MVKWKSENREKRNEMLYWIYECKIIIYFRQFKKQKKKLKIKENVLRGFQAINQWFSYRSSRVICTRQSRKHRSRSLQMNGRCVQFCKTRIKKKEQKPKHGRVCMNTCMSNKFIRYKRSRVNIYWENVPWSAHVFNSRCLIDAPWLVHALE